RTGQGCAATSFRSPTTRSPPMPKPFRSRLLALAFAVSAFACATVTPGPADAGSGAPPRRGARGRAPPEPGPPPPADRETSPAQKRPAQEADTRRPRGEDRAQSGRGALSLWGDVTFRRLRLLRAR